MPNYLTNVMCYDFTFPIGMINSLITTIDFCSDISTDSAELSNKNTSFNSSLKTGSKIDILNQSITNLIQDNFSEQSISQTASNYAEIKTPHGMGDENGCMNCGHTPTKEQQDNYSVLSENQNAPYQLPSRKFGSHKVKKGGSYFCDPIIKQNSTLQAVQLTDISTDVKQKIINKITGHVKDTLSERGSSKENMDISVGIIANIHDQLIENIDTSVHQITDQDVNVNLDLTYIDNYGVCGINEDGKSIGKVITQENDIKAISKNIINTTIDTIMENDTSIEAESNVTINNITNRIVFGSILWDLICLIILYYIIKML
jgi:hypothetical protein